MTQEHAIPELDRKGLREFGFVTGGIVAALFGVAFPWLLGRSWPLWPWIIFAALAFFALVAPMALNPVYRAWMRFGLLASRITTPLILGLVFFLMISPLGFVRRMFGRDALGRSFEADADSYRVQSRRPTKQGLERPF